MKITAQDVNNLRKTTGAGMMDCKKALVEANGDMEAAIDLLRKRGQKVSAKRADREASEGTVFAESFGAGAEGVIFALACETDFVAKNDDFKAMGATLMALAVAQKPADKDAFYALSMEDGRTVADNLTDLIGKIGEKIEVSQYTYLKAEKVAPYIHAGSKLGVLVALENAGESDYLSVGKDVGMQVAAMNPLAVNADQIDEATKERELNLATEKARDAGKPEAILGKIAQGALNKYFKENTLLSQPFVKNPKQTIADFLNSSNKGMTVTSFSRVALG